MLMITIVINEVGGFYLSLDKQNARRLFVK